MQFIVNNLPGGLLIEWPFVLYTIATQCPDAPIPFEHCALWLMAVMT